MRIGYVDVKSEGAILEASCRGQNGTWVHAVFNEEIYLLPAQIALLHCYRRDKQEQQHSVGHLEEEEEGKLQAHRFELTRHHARSLREPLTYF